MIADMKNWNYNVFGDIFKRKRRLQARIQGVQWLLTEGRVASLLKLETKLHKELDDVLLQEEILWFQKSREKWIKDGERNTCFFHTSTLVKRSANFINCLKDTQGSLIWDVGQMKEMVRNFYVDLFQAKDKIDASGIIFKKFTALFDEAKDVLNRSFTAYEIRNALFDMDPYKAPGPNGLHACFYKKCWNMVGPKLLEPFYSFLMVEIWIQR